MFKNSVKMPQQSEVQTDLRLDRILASQPELGPSIPDGGYGWIVLVAILFVQAILPSILISYGVLLLFLRLEDNPEDSIEPQIWDTTLIPAPVFFMATWSFSDPWTRLLVATSTWPRLVAVSGICLTCAGLLFQWIAIVDDHSGVGIFFLSGIFSGFGASLIMTQSDFLIHQYFRKKITLVNSIITSARALGFIVTPIILGLIIFKSGIPQGILIYQAIVLQLLVVVLVYKKPDYLKRVRRRYEPIHEEDDTIYPSQGTELRSTSRTTGSQQETTVTATKNEPQPTKQPSLLQESFAEDFSQDLSHSQPDDSVPTPIFIAIAQENGQHSTNPSQLSNDILTDTQDLSMVRTETSFSEKISFLWQPTFYKTWLMMTTIRYSALVFWLFFPSYLYFEMDTLNLKQTTFLVGCVGLGSLFSVSYLGFSSFVPVYGYGAKRQNTMAAFCFIGSLGHFVISETASEGWLLFGALLVTTSVTLLDAVHGSMINYLPGPEIEKMRPALGCVVSISLMVILIYNATYAAWHRIVSLLQFITGSVLLTSYFYKKIKTLSSRS